MKIRMFLIHLVRSTKAISNSPVLQLGLANGQEKTRFEEYRRFLLFTEVKTVSVTSDANFSNFETQKDLQAASW